MRKADAGALRREYDTEVEAGLLCFDRLSATASDADVSRLATLSFFSVFVGFERFLSDLILAYLNQEFTQYQVFHAARIRSSIKDKYGEPTANLVSFQTRTHVPMDEIERIVDPTSWNLTFASVPKLKDRTKEWLPASKASKFSAISAADALLIDTARAMRDFAAHRSPASHSRMNVALANVNTSGKNAAFARSGNAVNNLGSYLKSYIGPSRRLHSLGRRLVSVAQSL